MAISIGGVTYGVNSTVFGGGAPTYTIEHLESLSIEEIKDPIGMLQGAELAHIELSEESVFQIASLVRKYAHVACIKEGYCPNKQVLDELEAFIDRLSERFSQRTELLYALRCAKEALTLAGRERSFAIVHLLYAHLTNNKEEFFRVAHETTTLLMWPGSTPWYYLPLYFEMSLVFCSLSIEKIFLSVVTDKIVGDWSAMHCVVRLLSECVNKKKEQEEALSLIESFAKRAYGEGELWRVRELIVKKCLRLVKHDDALVAAKAKSILFEICMLERDPRVVRLLNTPKANALFKQMWNGKEKIGKKYDRILSLVERSLLAKQQGTASIIPVKQSDLTELKTIMGTLTLLQRKLGVDDAFLRRMNKVCGLFEETFQSA